MLGRNPPRSGSLFHVRATREIRPSRESTADNRRCPECLNVNPAKRQPVSRSRDAGNSPIPRKRRGQSPLSGMAERKTPRSGSPFHVRTAREIHPSRKSTADNRRCPEWLNVNSAERRPVSRSRDAGNSPIPRKRRGQSPLSGMAERKTPRSGSPFHVRTAREIHPSRKSTADNRRCPEWLNVNSAERRPVSRPHSAGNLPIP